MARMAKHQWLAFYEAELADGGSVLVPGQRWLIEELKRLKEALENIEGEAEECGDENIGALTEQALRGWQ